VQQEDLRAVAGDALELRLGHFEALVVGVLEGVVGRAGHGVAAAPEVVDERVALGVGLEGQERVELRPEHDRLGIGDEVLMPHAELLDARLALALAELAQALGLGSVRLRRGGRSGRLRQNDGGEGERQGSGERFHGFPG
jgi:hypothetical protein